MADKQKKPVTESTSLNRSLKPIHVWALALGSIIGWGAFVLPGTTFLPKGGPLGTLIGMSAAGVIMAIIAASYGYMIKKYPVAGGEYTYALNTFGKKHAFVCVWFLILAYLSHRAAQRNGPWIDQQKTARRPFRVRVPLQHRRIRYLRR